MARRPTAKASPGGLDTKTIARAIAKKIVDGYVVRAHALAPLRLEPDEVLGNLTKVIPKLAEVAAREADGPLWGLWLGCVEAAGIAPIAAASELLEHEALWFAGWCFNNDRDELGLSAYERVLALKRDIGSTDLECGEFYALRIGLNYFRDFLYIAVALRLGAPERALRAFAPVRAKLGAAPLDEVLFAALQCLTGEIDHDAASKVVARFKRSPVRLAQAARAVALDAMGDAAAAREVLEGFDRQFGHSADIRRELTRRFGAAFEAAMVRDPVPLPKRTRTPGFVVKRSRAKTPHVFAPSGPRGPECPTCGRAHRVWFSLDLAAAPLLAAKLPSWPTFRATACFDCDAWMRRHDLSVNDAFVIELTGVEPGTKSLAKATYSDDSSRSIPPQFAKLSKAPRDLEERPLDGDCQLGGDPAWIQDPVDVMCPGCEQAMVFVFRFSAPNGFDGTPEIAGGGGALYYFACGPCRRFTHLAQWT